MKLDEFLGQVRDVDPLESRREFSGEDFSSGVERGAAGLRSAAYGAAAGLTGSRELADRSDYAAMQAQDVPRRFNSFREVNPLNPLDLIDYGQQVAGEQVPNLAVMAAGGGIPGAVAKSALAARVGAGAASSGLQFGEMSNELRDIGKRPDLLTGGLAIAGGALDVFGLESLGKGMLQSAIGEMVKSDAKTSAAKRVLSGAWQGFKEGIKNELPAEIAQEDLAIINRAAHDPAYLQNTRDITNRLSETAASTVAFAGGAGAIPGGYSGIRSPTPQTPPSDSQSQIHNMSLDEMGRLPGSSTPQGATDGHEASQESTNANANETRQKQEVLNGTGASAPVSSNAAYALDFFQRKGLSRDDASALVGNLMAESGPGLDPNATNPSSGAYGIAQHLGSRKDALLAKGGQGNLDVQLGHVWDELNSTHKRALDAMLQGKTIEDKTYAIRKLYEIPGEKEARDQERFNFARRLAGMPEDVPANSGTMGSSLGRHVDATDFENQTDQTQAETSGGAEDYTPNDEGFTLTQKGKKQESTGDDVWSPDREHFNQDSTNLTSPVKESSVVSAFRTVYPDAEVQVSRDKTMRQVSVNFPPNNPLGDQDKTVAASILRAFSSGKEANRNSKIMLEHPSYSSEDGIPVEVPVTLTGLQQIGKSLDPNQSAYQAAISGLTHLVYENGFRPQELDINDPETGRKAFESWIETNLGKPPVTEDAPVRASERPMGLVKPGLPITHLMSDSGTSVGRETAARLGIPHRVNTPASKMQPTSRIVFEGDKASPANTDGLPELRIPRDTNPKTAAYQVQEFLREKGGERPHITASSKEHGAVLRKALMPGNLPKGVGIGSPDPQDDVTFVPQGDLTPPDGQIYDKPEETQVSTATPRDREADRQSAGNSESLVEQTNRSTRGDFEQVHEVPGGSTIRASGIPGKVVGFLSKALSHIGLQVPVRVFGREAIGQHIESLKQEISNTQSALEAAKQRLEGLNAFTNRKQKDQNKAEVKQAKADVRLHERRLADLQTEINNLEQASKDSFAARVIYNDHYLHVSDRAPIILVSEEALASDKLGEVLAHELGHVVQRAWFDQLEPEVKMAIINELSPDEYDPDEFAENFANTFMNWYRINRQTAGHQGRVNSSGPIEDIRAAQKKAERQFTRLTKRNLKGLETLFRAYDQLAKSLKKLWNNLVKQDKEFRAAYPNFDAWIGTSVGMYGKLTPVTPQRAKQWASEMANPRHGLPVRVYDTAQFRDMSLNEITEFADRNVELGKKRAADWASGSKVLQNKTVQAYLKSLEPVRKIIAKKSEEWLVAEGDRLRNSWGGVFRNWADIYAPEAGKERRVVNLISAYGKDNRMLGETRPFRQSLQNFVKTIIARDFMPKLAPINAELDKLSEEEQLDLWENLMDQSSLPKSRLALKTREYFRYLHSVLTGRFGMDIGEMTDYVTKSWDIDQFADPVLKDEIIQKFTDVYRAREELPVRERIKQVTEHPDGTETYGYKEVRFETPEAAAIQMYLDITNGNIELFPEQNDQALREGLRSSAFPYSRPRPFTEAEYEQFGLKDYLVKDVKRILATYTNAAARRVGQNFATGIPREQRTGKARAYWENRFLRAKLDPEIMSRPTAGLDLLLAEALEDGRIPASEAERARQLLLSSLGMKNVGGDPHMRKVVNNVLAWQTVTTMLFSGFMQLSDFGVTMWRGEDVGRAVDGIKELIDKESRENQRQILYDVGLAMDELSRGALQSETGLNADPLGRSAHTLTENFFKFNGMHQMSELALMYASVMGQSFIKDNSKLALHGETEEIRQAAQKKLNILYPNFDPNLGIQGDFRGDVTMGYALQAFVDQAHLHDQKGYSPEIFNDYRFKIFTQLKGFMFKYHNIVLKQLWQQMKDQPDLLRSAGAVAALAIPSMFLAFVGMEAKDAVRRKLFEAMGLKMDRPPKEKTTAQQFYDVAMATGMPGAYLSLFDQMSEAQQHGQPGIVAIMGPTVGTLYNMSARTADEWFPGLIPGVANIPWARAQVRSFLHDELKFGNRDDEDE